MKIRSMVAATVIGAGVLIGTAGCDPGAPCLRGHYEYLPQTHWIYTSKGRSSTYITIDPVWYCDEYGPEPTK
jgi:hypothetical protein